LITQNRCRVQAGLFSPGEARDYLAAKLAGTDLSQADELAADVGYLPLAQAASFILNQGRTCAEYRARLLDRRTRLARLFPEDAPADEYQATVAATWSISVETADRLHPRGVAAPLLRVLSMFDPNDVLPAAALAVFAELRVLLEVDPWAGGPVNPGNPDGPVRTMSFGPDHEGVAAYLILGEVPLRKLSSSAGPAHFLRSEAYKLIYVICRRWALHRIQTLC
jgi:hypothetical protein